MSEIIIHRSTTSADVGSLKGNGHERHDQVVFENVADQYVKGEDVIAHFTILNENKVNPTEDFIGLLRIGCTNIQECLAYAPVQFSSSTTSESTRFGTAIFPSASLPATDDEFFQFCYLKSKQKCLGSSIPFQLNCSIDDIDLLTSELGSAMLETRSRQSTNDGLIALADHDNDDLVVIHTKRMLIEEKLRQENQHLLELNRRLEQQKDECKAKFDLLELKSNEYINKVKHDIQALALAHKTTIDELATRQRLEAKLRTEYDACRALCNQYQAESSQFAERCRQLEEGNHQLSNEMTNLRTQLSIATKLNNEQLMQINDFEAQVLHSNEALKDAQQYHARLEQQLRDLRLTTEKYQMSVQAQLDAYTKQASQQENKINALESANALLKEELNSVKADKTFLLARTKDDKQTIKNLQERLEQMEREHQLENDKRQYELEALREELEQAKGDSNDFMLLKSSFNEIEKRCVKHQKSEIEVKKQLTVHKEFVTELQNKVQELTERLLAGADEYKTLYRKHAALERMVTKVNLPSASASKSSPTTLSNETGLNEEALVTLLRTSYELQQQDQQQETVLDEQQQEEDEGEQEQEDDDDENDDAPRTTSTAKQTTTAAQEEIRECPMCYWEFPISFTLDSKKDHIENHFA